jgi:type I restriction enzyme, S subunit
MPGEPADWMSARVGDLGVVQLGRQRSPSAAVGPNQTPYLRVANVFDGFIDYSDVLKMSFSEAERRVFYVRPGDILLNEGQSLELVGRSALYDGPPDAYCIQNTLVRFRCGDALVPSFARATFKRWMDTRVFARIAKQTTSIAHLGAGRFATLRMEIPLVPEQHRIAQVLDTLDEAIRKTEQVIDKLQQMKQGLLHDLMTRGVDENGELRDPERHPEQFKDSPLGQIPRGWQAGSLGRKLQDIDSGRSPRLDDTPARPGEWGVLKVSAVHPRGFRSAENKVIRDHRHVNAAYEVRDGDLLITRANTSELVGLTCLVRAPQAQLLLCDKTLRLRPSGGTSSEFLFHASQLDAVRRQIERNATGSSGSMKNISQGVIRGLTFPFPSPAEQRRIVQTVAGAERRLAQERRQAGKIRGLKHGLMDDLLTGRVRVAVPDEATT